jgi:hypothetical protein
MGVYDVAQLCLNGHIITEHHNRYPQFRQKFCQKCGRETIHQCTHCGTPIRGDYYVEGFIGMGQEMEVPSFCLACGKPYPWTTGRILAAQALAEEVGGLNDADRIMLKASIEQIATDTPMTEVAVIRIKKLLPKIAKESVGAMRRLLIDVAGKTAAELLRG